MLEYMHNWVNGRRLTKDAVRNHQNVRLGSNQGGPAQGSQAQHAGIQAQHKIQGYANHIPGVQQATAAFGQAQASSASSAAEARMGGRMDERGHHTITPLRVVYVRPPNRAPGCSRPYPAASRRLRRTAQRREMRPLSIS